MGGSLWGPALLFALVLLTVFIVGTNYSSRKQDNNADVMSCIDTTAGRASTAHRAQTEADLEFFLAGKTQGHESELHSALAKAASDTAAVLEQNTAPTLERREAYCHRLYPPPSLIGW